MMRHTIVTNHLYSIVQFCGFVGSSGVSHVAMLGSIVCTDNRLAPCIPSGCSCRTSAPSWGSDSSFPRDRVSELSWDANWIKDDWVELFLVERSGEGYNWYIGGKLSRDLFTLYVKNFNSHMVRIREVKVSKSCTLDRRIFLRSPRLENDEHVKNFQNLITGA